MHTPETEERSRRPSGARALVVVGALAVLIAFATSATAAGVVTGKQIANESITAKDLRDSGLQGRDVRDESLTQNDFATIVEGPRGPDGLQGPQGRPGSSGLVHVVEPLPIAKFTTRTWVATCPPGTRALSGGGSTNAAQSALLVESAPADDAGSGWLVGINNRNATSVTGYAWALCVRA